MAERIIFLFLFSVLKDPLFGASYLLESKPVAAVGQVEERNSEEWRDICANFSQGNLKTGDFATPNYPLFYPAGVECIRVIHAPSDYTILLDFRGPFFEIEKLDDQKWRSSVGQGSSTEAMSTCAFDYLEVRKGPFGFSPLIGRYCGNKFPPVIAADSGSMWLMFKSDRSVEYRGFRAVHYAAPKLGCSLVINPFNRNAVLSTEEVQQRANGTGKWPVECVWKVDTKTTVHKLRVYFEKFELQYPNQCNMNSVEVYARTTSKRSMVKRLCGRGASYVDTQSPVTYIRIVLAEGAFMKSIVSARFIPYATGNDCHGSMFSCGDGTCIPRSLMCNQRMDCFTNQDERDCATGDSTLVEFFSSPYLAILIVIMLLIASIISCTIFANVRYRMNKVRSVYNPVPQRAARSKDARPKRRRRSPLAVEITKLLLADGPVDPTYSTHVPGGPDHRSLTAGNGVLCQLLPTASDNPRLNSRQRGRKGGMDLVAMAGKTERKNGESWTPIRRHPCQSPETVRSLSIAGSPTIRPTSASLSSQLWSLSPPSARVRPSPSRDSALARCSSQSTVSEHCRVKMCVKQVHSTSHSFKKKVRSGNRPRLLTTSRAYYQNRSTSSCTSRNEMHPANEHKFWARMEDLITTTEESDAAESRRNRKAFDNETANLSDPANRHSSNEGSSNESDCGQNGGNEWMCEADSILESEALKENESAELALSAYC